MTDSITVGERLKTEQRSLRHNFSEALGLRVHRAISWFKHAEKQQDEDGQFIFLWIAFNAAYANDVTDTHMAEREVFNRFLKKIIDLDEDHQIYNLLWQKYPNAIRVLLDNRYVFQPYWDCANGLISEDEWKQSFDKAKIKSNKAIASKDTATALQIVFARLYTLRNQMIHGGATHNSAVNRDQLRDACDIMLEIMPLIIRTMMAHPNALWGDAIYPVKD